MNASLKKPRLYTLGEEIAHSITHGIGTALSVAGLTMLLVEQNVHMALSVSDYAYVLAEGRVSLSGPASEVASQDHVRKAYLGI